MANEQTKSKKRLVFYERKDLNRISLFIPPSKDKRIMGKDGKFYNEDLEVRFGTPQTSDPDDMVYFDFQKMETYDPSIFTDPTLLDEDARDSLKEHRFVLTLKDSNKGVYLTPENGDFYYQVGKEDPVPIRTRKSHQIDSRLSCSSGKTIELPEKSSLLVGRGGLAIATVRGYSAMRTANKKRGFKRILEYIGIEVV